MSDLMEDFFDTEFYDSAIEKSLDKQISTAQIRKFCTVAFRLKLLQDLEEESIRLHHHMFHIYLKMMVHCVKFMSTVQKIA